MSEVPQKPRRRDEGRREVTVQTEWIVMTPEKRKRARLLWDQGYRVGPIARTLGVYGTSVRQALVRQGIDPKPRWAAVRKRPKIEAAIHAGKSNEDIIKEVKTTAIYVNRLRRVLKGFAV